MGMLSDPEIIRGAVRQHYANAARGVQEGPGSCCCSSDGCGCGSVPTGYDLDEIRNLSASAPLASFGCGNPLLLVDLEPGQVVLDLGPGAGLDVILSAKRVAPTGTAYGLDMTDEMLDLARRNAALAGAENAEFLKGTIERIPLPDGSVDVILSNCVINLSADKGAVLREAYRVLRPGGRFAVADVVIQGEPPSDAVRREMALWSSCISGALMESEYVAELTRAGFEEIRVEIIEESRGEGACCSGNKNPLGPTSRAVSALIRAAKPE